MPDIKIDDNCLFEEIRRLNIYLKFDKLEQWENQHVEIDKRWVEIFNHFKNEHIPYENLIIPVEFTLCCPGTNAAVERVFSMGNDFWLSEKSRLNVDTLAAALTLSVQLGIEMSILKTQVQWQLMTITEYNLLTTSGEELTMEDLISSSNHFPLAIFSTLALFRFLLARATVREIVVKFTQGCRRKIIARIVFNKGRFLA
uniref:Dimer_Tnp_hAT domain-containing protein n=1 Tax=Rhodnius prolixus TaxID=13249 RepID=T1HEI2_RHOPR